MNPGTGAFPVACCGGLNLRISTRRAESVHTYLIEKFGISANRLSARGYGLSCPVADNATPEGRKRNRRIEAVIETTITR